MRAALAERDDSLAALVAAVGEARAGRGSVAWVHGEAGSGKSALVSAMSEQVAEAARVLTGWCDDLDRPRPFGPFHDLVPEIGALRPVLEDPAGSGPSTVLQAELNRPGEVTVLVVEDVHWADAATLDVLRVLARRIVRWPAVLVLTCRDDSAEHRARSGAVLGTVAGDRHIHRLHLAPLSPAAVRRMDGDRADTVHALTAGNPFLVTQLLAAGAVDEVPGAVSDAARARLRRLPAPARRAVEQLAVIPAAAPLWLISALLPRGLADLAAAEEHGLLQVEGNEVAFRHELNRRAVAGALSGSRRVELNRRVLAALGDRPGVDPVWLLHHADEAGDAATVVHVGARLAEDAARTGAHRRAAGLYQRMLAHRGQLAPADHADLLERYAVECHTLGTDGVSAQRSAVRLREALDDRRALGCSLRRLAQMQWWQGRHRDAETTVARAVDQLGAAGDPEAQATAYYTQVRLHLVSGRTAAGMEVSRRARRLATTRRDAGSLPRAVTDVGTALWIRGARATGRSLVASSLGKARTTGDIDEAGQAAANLAWMLIDDLRLDIAAARLAPAIRLAEQAEHLGWWQQLRAIRGYLRFLTGQWEAAIRDAGAVADDAAPLARCTSLVVAGRIRVRQGLPGGDEMLVRAIGLARDLGADQLGVASAGRAEAAWLRGDTDSASHLAQVAAEKCARFGHSRLERAELAHWLARSNGTPRPGDPEHPYDLHRAGRLQEAAARWQQLGCPYERAAALADSDRPADVFTAVEALETLGAGPLAARARSRLGARKRVTQHDLAALIGVSQPTVSIALNSGDGDSRVSPHVRARVLRAAEVTGYLAAQARR